MRSFILLFLILIISSCSFDNKTGIWKDAENVTVDNQSINTIENNNIDSRYEDVFIKNKIFNEIIEVKDTSNFSLEKVVGVNNWVEKYGTKKNNISNYSYKGLNTLLSKSSKLNKLATNENIIFYDNNLITYDHQGTIFIYSIDLKKKIFKYNFYKKKYKNFEKKIYLTMSENILYAADNLGFLYAIDLNEKSVIWAKNYGIPFRSNIKIAIKQIILASQDNVVYSINPKTGIKNWQFATSLTAIKSDFENNFAIDEVNNNLLFLNTSGELYSINYKNKKINWVLNFKNPSLAEDTDLFLSNPIVVNNNNFIVSTEKAILKYDSVTGSRDWTFPSNSILKPILTNNYTYIISQKNLIICIDNQTGKALWSQNIYKKVEKKIIKKIGILNDFKIANNKVNIFSSAGYLLSYNFKDGNLKYIKKISKNGISSKIVYLKDKMFLIDKQNKLLKFN
jgi:outer membrane protein assembly factor BamB